MSTEELKQCFCRKIFHLFTTYFTSQKLTQSLFRHQKEALDFISQREFGPVPTRFSLWKAVSENGDRIPWFVHAQPKFDVRLKYAQLSTCNFRDTAG